MEIDLKAGVLTEGLNQAIVSNTKECAHCGLPCDEHVVLESDLSFCCSGCAAVFTLLNDSNMCRYYEDGKGLTPESTEVGGLDFLDEAETADKFKIFSQGDTVQYKFRIPGMHCNSCIYLLERLDRLNPSVLSSRVDFFNKELIVTVKNGPKVLSSLVTLLFSLGYKPDLTLSNNSGAKKSKFSPRAIKIGIAGFCFGNIMMLSFPEYLGLSLDASSVALKHWFDYISLALSLPVLFYCSSEFFESSYKAIKTRTLNIDLPITLAIVAAFGRSLYELFVMNHSGYFDSMTGIVFLLLTGRYFQDLSYHSLTFDRDYRSYFPLSARLMVNGTSQVVNISKLQENDTIELRNSELLPADAILSSGMVTVDYSFITGESKPVAVQEGEKVYAGAVINGRSAQFKLLGSTDNSRLVKLWAIEKDKSEVDNSLTEKLNYYFTLGLLLVGAFAFIYQYNVNGLEEAFKSLTSVLIVACPCILLLATTFANGHLLRTLKNNGMFVKNKNTLSQMAKCDTFVFDKTGTLTDNKAFEVDNKTSLNAEELNMVGFLCHQSVHPYSVAIAHAFYKVNFQLDAYTDFTGKGLQGLINLNRIKLGSAHFLKQEQRNIGEGQSAIHVEINGVYKGCFLLTHRIRPETNSVLLDLKLQGYALYLSSGDNELNPEINHSVFEETLIKQQPEDKVALVKQLKNQGKVVCMAGDGLNDAPALKEADVAVSVADHENSFFPACDVLLTANALGNLPSLMQMVKAAKWVVIVSFAFSLIYNVIGLYFAITAQLSPLTAAILMPSSSISMLIIAWVMTNAMAKLIIKKEQITL
jgi:Cu+-exporting ATPase